MWVRVREEYPSGRPGGQAWAVVPEERTAAKNVLVKCILRRQQVGLVRERPRDSTWQDLDKPGRQPSSRATPRTKGTRGEPYLCIHRSICYIFYVICSQAT
jgi:hypothetical protein